MITFNNEKCTKCGICAQVCPVGIILQDEDKAPFIMEESFSICRRCGHCESYCPTGAVSSIYEGEYPSRDKGPFLAPEELEQHLYSRRTCRLFQEKLVEKGKIEDIIDVVRYAPSASNRQPVKWMVLDRREKVRYLAGKVAEWMAVEAARDTANPYAPVFKNAANAFREGKDMITRQAPQMILTIVPTANPFGQTDSTIALTWFEILCQSYGIGTCWLGLVKTAASKDPSILEHLDIPQGYELGYPMAFGYARHPVITLPKRNRSDIAWK